VGHSPISTVDEKYIQTLAGNMKGRYHLKDLGVDGRIILKLYFRNTA
jgi:hypothetical protein